jgi:hypothetical protein
MIVAGVVAMAVAPEYASLHVAQVIGASDAILESVSQPRFGKRMMRELSVAQAISAYTEQWTSNLPDYAVSFVMDAVEDFGLDPSQTVLTDNAGFELMADLLVDAPASGRLAAQVIAEGKLREKPGDNGLNRALGTVTLFVNNADMNAERLHAMHFASAWFQRYSAARSDPE